MDNRRFGSSYGDLSEKKTPSNPERREILKAPREWMRFFNETMKNYLAGNEPPEKDAFIEKITKYYEWSYRYLGVLMQQAREIDNPTEQNDVANEFIFHQINGPLTFLWYSLLYSETDAYSPAEITDMQTHLAVSMTGPSRRLKMIDEKPSAETFKEYKMLKGTLSEADTVITLMELMKEEPRLIVLPAPEMFESSKESINRNVDVLVIDTLNKQVRGVQVKTNTIEGTGGHRKYDKEYVTVVDSAYELGNMFYNPKSRDQKHSLPGQIAMSLLSERPINKLPIAVTKPDYMRSRQIAKEISRGRKSFLPQAVHHLAERIIPELAVDAVLEATQDYNSDEQIA